MQAPVHQVCRRPVDDTMSRSGLAPGVQCARCSARLQWGRRWILACGTAVALSALSAQALAQDFQCTVVSGVSKIAGKPELEDAAKRDRLVIGSNFLVERATGKVRGNSLFQNTRHQVEILRDETAAYEVLTRTRHADISLLRIDALASRWTFKYYNSWLGLFLTGECNR